MVPSVNQVHLPPRGLVLDLAPPPEVRVPPLQREQDLPTVVHPLAQVPPEEDPTGALHRAVLAVLVLLTVVLSPPQAPPILPTPREWEITSLQVLQTASLTHR